MHAEMSKVREIKQALQGPVLKTLYGAKEVSARVNQLPAVIIVGEGNELLNLQTQREEFMAFSKQWGLSNYALTQEDMLRESANLTSVLAEMPQQEFIQTVLEFKKAKELRNNLILAANTYVRIQLDLEASGLSEDVLEGEDANEIIVTHSAYKSERDSKYLPQDDEGSLALVAREEQLTGYQKQAYDFACYKEAFLANYFFDSLVKNLTDKIGVDVASGKLSIEEAVKFEDIERRTKPLPSLLAGWKERGLMNYSVEDRTVGFYDDMEEINQAARVALPAGVEDSSVQEYLQAEQERESIEAALRTARSSDRSQAYLATRKAWKKLLAIKTKIFDSALEVFSQAEENFHPSIEKYARRFAAYALTTGAFSFRESRFGDYQVWEGQQDLPLAQSVPTLRKIAYERGIYLDPLKEKMNDTIQIKELKPDQLVELIITALDETDRDPNYLATAKLTADEKWFVRETLFSTASTIDTDGKYQTNDSQKDLQRSPEVVESLIEYLQGLSVMN